MKNKDLLDMILQLHRATHALREMRTEGGCSVYISVDLQGVHISEDTFLEYFGLTGSITGRGSGKDEWPYEVVADYKGVRFIALLTEAQARDMFGYTGAEVVA